MRSCITYSLPSPYCAYDLLHARTILHVFRDYPPRTLSLHFIAILHGSTSSLHFITALTLYCTLSVHFIAPLHRCTSSLHFIAALHRSLHRSTSSLHFIPPLHRSTSSLHFIAPLHRSTSSLHFIAPLTAYCTMTITCLAKFAAAALKFVRLKYERPHTICKPTRTRHLTRQ
jgi:hypothetical protein